MLTGYSYLVLFLAFAVFFTVSTILIPTTLRFLRLVPSKPNRVKNAPFECGMETIGKTWVQFNFRYYYYALIFLAFDVLVVFLYPFAVELRRLGTTGLATILIFLGIILIGYIYAWKKKVLEWK